MTLAYYIRAAADGMSLEEAHGPRMGAAGTHSEPTPAPAPEPPVIRATPDHEWVAPRPIRTPSPRLNRSAITPQYKET